MSDAAEVQGQEAPQGVNIGLQDLATLRNIVDLASQRGAFKGAELTQVGAVFDKLNTFLAQVAEAQAAAAEEAEGAQEKEASEE